MVSMKALAREIDIGGNTHALYMMWKRYMKSW